MDPLVYDVLDGSSGYQMQQMRTKRMANINLLPYKMWTTTELK
jgi:hypothetical protein